MDTPTTFMQYEDAPTPWSAQELQDTLTKTIVGRAGRATLGYLIDPLKYGRGRRKGITVLSLTDWHKDPVRQSIEDAWDLPAYTSAKTLDQLEAQKRQTQLRWQQNPFVWAGAGFGFLLAAYALYVLLKL